jgi:replicative DNA helicase
MSLFKPDFFNWKEHGTIYTLITSTYQEKQAVDITLLIIKLNQLGLTELHGLDIGAYIKTLASIPVNREFVLDYFREIFKMHTCRRAFASLSKAQDVISGSLDKSLREILDEVQTIVSDSLAANIDERVKITDVYSELEGFLSERSKQNEPLRLETGFKTFDHWYGGLYLKGVYVFAAPAKVGKSTFLNYLAYQMAAIPKNNLKVLVLDTELETEFAMSRATSCITGENEFHFLEGDFARIKHIAEKTKKALNNIDHLKGRVFHSYIGNLGIEEVLAVARRWYVTHVKSGESALIIYDYIKLSGGSDVLGSHWKEYQEIGEKTDKLKKFISSLPRAALATSIQTNAAKEVAMSKQVLWFANNVYILDRKTLDEIQNDGVNFGTHKLVEVVTRNQGKGANGAQNYFKIQNTDGRHTNVQNHLNFDFSNFSVKEVGTNEDAYSQRASNLTAQGGTDLPVTF